MAKPRDADQVATAVAAALFRYDTRLDVSPQDAARRAAAWMTPDLAARQKASVAGGGAWWTQLAAGDGWTTTTTAPDPEPTPNLGPLRAFRRVYVTSTAHVRAGATAPAPAVQQHVVLIELNRASATSSWRAAQTQDASESGS